MVIRFAIHELCPTTEDGSIRRKDTITLRNGVEPILDFFGLRDILAPSDLYPRLYLTDRYSGNI